jgi:hypothetical protein
MDHKRWIVYYQATLKIWLVKVGTNLTQIEIEGLILIMMRIPSIACTNDSLHEMEPCLPKTLGDTRPTMKKEKSFQYIPKPLLEHYTRINHSKTIECSL